MPEFWTWRIQNGPTTCTPSPSARWLGDDVLRQLVGDDRRERDRRERQPLRRASPRTSASRDETGVKRVRRRADAHVELPSGLAHPPSAFARAVDAERRPRMRLEPLDARSPCRSWRTCRTCRPRSAAARRRSRRAPARSSRRACSRSRGRASRVAVSARWLSLVAGTSSTSSSSEPGCSSRSVASACSTRSRSSRSASRKCSVSMLVTASPFFLGRPPEAEARRRSISAGPIPVSSTILSRPPWPETSVSDVRGQRERLGEEAEDGLVRAAALGRLGDAHLPGVAVPADDRCRGPRRG